MKQIVLGVVFFLGLLGAVSCARRIDFDPPTVTDMTVRITPQWSASVAQPAELRVMFYQTNGTLYQSSLLPSTGGEVTLAEADYRVVLCNLDADQVVVGLMNDFLDVRGRINWIEQTDSVQLIASPGALYSSVCELNPAAMDVKPEMIARSIGVTILLEAQDAVLQESQRVTVQLRNVADGIKLSTGKPFHISDHNLEVCPLTRRATTKVEGSFLYSGSIFGCCDNDKCLNPTGHAVYADIEITATNGSVRLLSVDVSAAIIAAQQAAHMGTVQIDITVVRMALQAVVSDWSLGTASGDVL